MPLYEYKCQQCHQHTEKRQKFSDPEITECPHCGGKLERVLSAPAISFKGGGWYADGYGNRKPAASSGSGGDTAAKSESAAPPSSAGDSASKSAAAPAAPSAAPAPSSTPAAKS